MEQENRNQNDSVFSRKIRAGRRRTYFFDVRTTKANDYYLTITESKKRNDNHGYERHKVFIYKEDLNKFIAELTESVNYIKDKMPDFDFDSFSHVYDQDENYAGNSDNDSAPSHPEEKQQEIKEEVKTPPQEEKESPDESENNASTEDHEDLKW